MHRMSRIAAVGISVILVASACGSDDDAADPQATDYTNTTTRPPGAPDEAMLRQAVEDYVAAFGNGDPDAAVSLLSQRCTDTEPMAEYRAAVAAAGELYPNLVVDEFSDIVLDEDRAVVFYSTDPEVETEDGERWIVESGEWAWDDC
jgi:hypothetical protein